MQCPKKEVLFQSVDHNCTNFFSELKVPVYIYIYSISSNTPHSRGTHTAPWGHSSRSFTCHSHRPQHSFRSTCCHLFLPWARKSHGSSRHIWSILSSYRLHHHLPTPFYTYTFGPFLMIIEFLMASNQPHIFSLFNLANWHTHTHTGTNHSD